MLCYAHLALHTAAQHTYHRPQLLSMPDPAQTHLTLSVLCRAVALQGYLVVIPDYFKGNPRKQSDSMDTFAEW